MDNETTPKPEPPQIRFVDGELTGLRPVLEGDLEALVHVLNANPVPFAETPVWTHARLKKKFEDEKDPGLWTQRKRWYVVTRRDGGALVGVICESHERTGESGLQFQFAPDATEAEARDALAAYSKYRNGFYTIPRVNVELAGFEQDKIDLLTELGFIYQARLPECLLWQGSRADIVLYSWIPEWVLARRAPDGGAAE